MGRPPKYPWADWMSKLHRDGELHLVAGDDFEISPGAIRIAVHAHCRKDQVDVKTKINGDTVTIRLVKVKSYPWDLWLDGQPRVITWGQDFHVTCADMVRTIRRAAKRRGMRVSTQVRGDRVRFTAFASLYHGLSPADRARMSQQWQREDDQFHAYADLVDSNALEST